MSAAWPAACAAARPLARLKAVPDDFHVAEIAACAPEGAGEHLLLRVEKTALSTRDVAAWLGERRRRRVGHFRAGLFLSVLRSYLFNEVLARRVQDGTWNVLVPGDVAVAGPTDELSGTRPVRDPAAIGTLPTGPLWGRGRSPVSGRAAELEREALAPHAALRDGLEHVGLAQARRSLVLRADDLDWQRAGDGVELTFTLPPGGYATSLLAEVFAFDAGGDAP